MSTFGNKGERERNPNKPKFAALDINSLYRSTRGETFEPATQKNAAPRKHGMQSLGKVPSARRPPANLPSLKAETTPISPQAQISNEQQQQQHQQHLQQQQHPQQQNQHQQYNTANNNPLWTADSNNSGGAQNIGPTLSNSTNNIQGQGVSSNNNNNNSSWSSVAIGNVKEDSALQPPLYQSPQFQNEFPSLDGTTLMTTSSSSINVSAMTSTQKLQNQNSFDTSSSNGANLRPSTDSANWMQQQQPNSVNSGNVRGAGGENGQNFPITEIDGPPKVMALMPSFLRGANTGIANINSTASPMVPNQQNKQHNMINNNIGHRRNHNNYNDYSNNGLPPPRHHHRQQPPRHSGRQNNNNIINNQNNNNNDDRNFEPELIVQRPIIKEEELDRIDSLARDDAWSKHDEIDYNKKLQFSDDEPDDMKPKDSGIMDKKIDAWRDTEKRDMKQNGPRSMDGSSHIDKMKMVRDNEEQRIERERKTTAQRKLHEIDEKSKQKLQISLDKPHEKEMDEKQPQTISGINYTISDDKKIDHHSQQQRDYGKSTKYVNDNKYDTYDSQYLRNRGNAGEEFKKSTFQSNLPPRFQKQHQHIDRPMDERREKGSQSSNSYNKPLHQQDSKNIPFVQHPQPSSHHEQQRWVQYNKGSQHQQQQPGLPIPRRNMSSLSQSSSDDNRQNNIKQQSSYRRRQESEEDDYGRYIKESSSATAVNKKSTTIQTTQISRSMSDSSEKLSDHNRSEKSTSREYLTGSNVCWAEVCENDKRSSLDAKEKRRVSESSAISDDMPRTILQRNKPIQEQLQAKDVSMINNNNNNKKDNLVKETMTIDEQKTVLNECPPKDPMMDNENVVKKENKDNKMSENQVITEQPTHQQQQQPSSNNKKSLEIIPEKEQQNMMSDNNSKNNELSAQQNKEVKSKEMDNTGDNRHSGGNKRSPHSNRYEQQQQSSRGRGGSSYGGGYRGNWQQRRGSGHPRSGGRYDYSDSENSEEYDHDWNNRGSKTNRNKEMNRRENYGSSNNSQKEGFSPRGEPSRRGRGGGITGGSQSSNYRRTGSNISNSSIVKRVDNYYGPPSSKSPFGSNDEKTNTNENKKEASLSKDKEKSSDDDRTKQKQKALSDGLINKNMKENSNISMQKSSSPSGNIKSNDDSPNKQHSNDSTAPPSNSTASISSTTQSTLNTTNQDSNNKKINNDNSEEKSEKSLSTSSGNRQTSYNANNRQPKFDSKTNSSTSSNKSTINKTSLMSSSSSQQQLSSSSGKATSSAPSSTNVSQNTSSQYINNTGSKPIIVDNRTSNNISGNYRDPRSSNNSNDTRNNGSNRMAPRFVKQQRDISGPNANSNRSGNYWDKNNTEGLNNESENNANKISLMQQLNNSNNSHTTSSQNSANNSLTNNQQQQMTNQTGNNSSNMLNSKSDVMKQQQIANQASQPQQTMTSSSTAVSSQQPMLDGASLPKQTLIFENTSYKTAPPSLKRPPPQLGGNAQNTISQQQQQQKDSTPTINEMIEQQAKDHSLSSALQNLSFGQKSSNDMVDMNFKFSFDTQLTDEGTTVGFGSSNTSAHTSQVVSKTSSSSLGLVGAKTGMQNSNILNTDALNMKVASCKKVWEEPSVDHSTTNTTAEDVMANFVAQQQLQQHYAAHNNMSAHHTGLSTQSFGYTTSTANDHVVQSSLEHFNKSNDNDDNNSYPSPHMSAAHAIHSQSQQATLNMKAVEAFSAATANVCKVKPTQQQMHQPGLSPPPQMQQPSSQLHQQQYYQTPNYANMPTIPSPPVVYNSAQATAGGLYNPYNMDAARAQMYSYPAGSTTNNSLSFNAFMQTPNLTSAPTHEIYQNLSQYRATVQPFNQTPQLNNPNTAVLISSATASNSMMASKSNTPQQIGAIGSKSSAPQNAPPTAPTGQYNQQYMNHLYHQNSYYPNSTAQQAANPYYNATGTATTGNYGMFGSTSAAPPPQQQMNYGSVGQYPLNSQMLNNLVINQQYRSGPVVNAAGSSSNSGSATSGSNSASGYMKQQQQQQQLQDPASTMKYSNMNNDQKSYNWEMSPINSHVRGYNTQNSFQNYNSFQHQSSSQKLQKNASNNQLFPSLTTSQGKSQFSSNTSHSSLK